MTGLSMILAAVAITAGPSPDTQEDRNAITELLEATVRSLNEQDLNANKRLFAEDGDHINPMGTASRGREEISAMMAEAYEQYGHWKSRCRALETRFLEPDVAIEIREWSMVEPPEGLKLPDPSPELLVHVKRAKQWRILAARPLIPFRADRQQLPSELPTAAGISDPAFVREVEGWQSNPTLAEDVIVISSLGNIYRGRDAVRKFLAALSNGRTSLSTKIRSARKVSENVAIVDSAFEGTGRWEPPNRPVLEGTVRGMWCAVYSRKDGKWELAAARAMIPFVPK